MSEEQSVKWCSCCRDLCEDELEAVDAPVKCVECGEECQCEGCWEDVRGYSIEEEESDDGA